MSVPTIAIPTTSLSVAASPTCPRSGGTSATVQRKPAATDQSSREPGTNVDERRRARKHGADEQPNRNRDHETRVLLVEEHLLRAERVQSQKAASRHEGERKQENTSVSAPVGRLASCVPEDQRDPTNKSEDDEVNPIVLDARIKFGAQEQGDEADQRKRGREYHGQPPHGLSSAISIVQHARSNGCHFEAMAVLRRDDGFGFSRCVLGLCSGVSLPSGSLGAHTRASVRE
jgi:hypothetical protein